MDSRGRLSLRGRSPEKHLVLSIRQTRLVQAQVRVLDAASVRQWRALPTPRDEPRRSLRGLQAWRSRRWCRRGSLGDCSEMDLQEFPQKETVRINKFKRPITCALVYSQ